MKWKPAVLADFTNFTYTMFVYILTMLLNCFHWLSNILVLGLFYGFLGGLLQEVTFPRRGFSTANSYNNRNLTVFYDIPVDID